MTERVNDKDIDFNLIFASAAPSVRELEEAQYLKGWSFLGDEIPPEFEDFDSVMRLQDRKIQILKQASDGVDDKIAAVSQKVDDGIDGVNQKVDEEIAALDKKIEKSGGGYVTQVMWHSTRKHLPAGCLLSDGQEVDRATWPSLFEEIEAGRVPVVPEADWLANPKLRGSYTLGDGVNTFRVPDYNGRSVGSLGRIFLGGDGQNAGLEGQIQESANKRHSHAITDNGHSHGVNDAGHSHEKSAWVANPAGGGQIYRDPEVWITTNAADKVEVHYKTGVSTSGISLQESESGITLAEDGEADARPSNVAGCYIIRGAGEKMNEGSVDALQLATLVNQLAAKVASLEEQGNAGYVGKVDWHPLRESVPHGRIPADGQLLSRELYPALWEAVRDRRVPVTTEELWNSDGKRRGCYTEGDGSTNFRVPDYNGKTSGSLGAGFLRGDGLNSLSESGMIQGDAIRNIKGYAGAVANYKALASSGALSLDADQGPMYVNGANTGVWAALRNMSIDVSKAVPTAADNHPVNVTGCFVIQYAGAVINSGYVDAVKAIEQISKLDSRVGALESKPQLFEIMYPYGTPDTPATLGTNQRLVFHPPAKFNGRTIQCKLQLRYNGFWHDWSTFIYDSNGSASSSTGAMAGVVNNGGSATDTTPTYIVIQTSKDALGTESRFDGNIAGLSGWLTEAHYRVLIWSVD
ncbi:tail fiber protein [Yersinia phage vB_YenM_281]|nr:tail fiber protein [Yersinia phage vB_YenM_281]